MKYTFLGLCWSWRCFKAVILHFWTSLIFFSNTVDMWVFHRSMVLMFFFHILSLFESNSGSFSPLVCFFFSEYTIVSPEILQKKCIKRKECKAGHLLCVRFCCSYSRCILPISALNFSCGLYWCILTGVAKMNQMSYIFVTGLNFKAFRLRV